MSKIKCPHCGKWQEAYPYIIICGNCYADIKEVIEEHFKEQTGKGAGKAPERSEQPTWVTFSVPKQPAAVLFKKIRTAAKSWTAREGLGLSVFGVILKGTFETFFKRFWPLYPLAYLSLSFFMVIGIFVSVLGLQILFPEQYPADPTMTLVFAVGIGACLFVFLYAQAAFVFAVANRELTLGDALMGAWQRFGSYLAVIVLMVVSVGAGTVMLLIPGVIAGILFSFAPFVLARENVGPIAALSKSVCYVVGSWLQLSLRLGPVAIVVIFTLFFFAYVGGPILMAVKNGTGFIFIISAFVTVPIVIITVFVFTIYDDLRTAEGILPSPEAAALPQPEEVTPEAAPAAAGLLPHAELMSRSWALYRKRFVPLTILNLISYLPHAIYLAVLLVPLLGLQTLATELHKLGEYGFLIFFILPPRILILVAAAALVGLILLILAQIFGLVLYLLLELAYVYAITDETIGAWGAIRKARKRLRGFFWAQFYRNFIVSTGWMLLFPGAVFWVWYQFTPYVFALQREEGTPLSSLQESRELVRGLWGTVFKEMLSLQLLPLLLGIILVGFIFAGVPFYWVFGSLLFSFTGHYPPSMFAIYSPHFWLLLYFSALLLFVGLYLPFQKVVLYVLYKELKDTKAARDDQSA